MISLVQMPTHRRYTSKTVRLEEYGLTYFQCSHYKCNVTHSS